VGRDWEFQGDDDWELSGDDAWDSAFDTPAPISINDLDSIGTPLSDDLDQWRSSMPPSARRGSRTHSGRRVSRRTAATWAGVAVLVGGVAHQIGSDNGPRASNVSTQSTSTSATTSPTVAVVPSTRPEVATTTPPTRAPSTATTAEYVPGIVAASAAGAATGDIEGTFTVERVVDGDTVVVRVPGGTQSVRLIGIDTPETKDPRKPVQCFGREASQRAHELLDGNDVLLEFEPSQGRTDKYDRWLAYVWLTDGTLVNERMIAEGYAFEYTYDLPYRHRDRFIAAEQAASSAQVGLWAPDACGGSVETTTPAGTAAPSNNGCDPNYSPCVPIANDVDCAGGSGNGPAYVSGPVQVIGVDIYGLDRDGDGTGCDS
jgi:micrococcal nuclease